MNKYRVENCPAISFAGGCKNREVKVWDCQDCTDCLMKNIVELCKDAKTECKYCECYDTHLLCLGEKIFAEKILALLDIEEVE